MDDRNMGDEGVGALLTRVMGDGRAYVEAEIGYWRALVADRLADAKSAALLGIVALLVVNAAVIALIVGLVLTLTPLVGAGLATLIVVAVAGVAAALLARAAIGRIRRVTRPRSEP